MEEGKCHWHNLGPYMDMNINMHVRLVKFVKGLEDNLSSENTKQKRSQHITPDLFLESKSTLMAHIEINEVVSKLRFI